MSTLTDTYTIGIDYGTDSVRAILVNTNNGALAAQSVFYYPRWKSGAYCNPLINQFRQHPLDYTEGLEHTVREILKAGGEKIAKQVVAISVDTTGSTPVAVNKDGTPLALTPRFCENPNAMFVLWKDHTAVKEAAEINQLAQSDNFINYTKFEGGVYSSEWFWAKILHVLRTDPEVREEAYSWVEHCDWIPALLTGNEKPERIKRSRCAAGHKAMWHPSFGGLPPESFFEALDPLLSNIRPRLYTDTYTCDTIAGSLSPVWAKKLGLSEKVLVGVGSFDAHLGALGGEIKPFYLSKVMGTSTCDILIAPEAQLGNKLIAGICGQVDGSVVPGLVGLEAGQSAFGDVYAWFKKLLLWPTENLLSQTRLLSDDIRDQLIGELGNKLLEKLDEEAQKLEVNENDCVALDWLNGRRTPDANQWLKGAVFGLTLGTDAPKMYKAMVEATAFGAKKIVDRFVAEGVPIEGMIALGGVAKKSSYVMQVVADVINKPILVAKSEQACALGAAMAAAVVGGVYPSLEVAQQRMGQGFEKEYIPDPKKAEIYEKLYAKYDAFGRFVETITMADRLSGKPQETEKPSH